MSEITREQWDELYQKYEELRLNEEMYRVAVGMTDHTISVVDIPNHTLNQIYNEGSWTGVSVSMEDAPESIIATGIIHPDDCEGYRAFYQDIYSGVPKGEYTMRVIEENRGWVWFTMYYQTVFDDAGNPMRAICFSDDITPIKNAEIRYRQFRDAVTADAEYVWEINISKDEVIVEEDKFAEQFGGQYPSFTELQKRAIAPICDPELKAYAEATFGRDSLLKAYDEARRDLTIEYPCDFNDGRGVIWLSNTVYLMTDSVGDVIAIICTNDITESKHDMLELEQKAELDGLTGVCNRATFEMKVEELLRENPDLVHGFILMDVDDFKQYNDNYGHAFGDSILQLVAGVLKDTFRSDDIIGRIGGDEFVIFMFGAGSAGTIMDRAKTIRRNLMDVCRKQELLLTVTVSVGVTVSDKDCNDLRSLYLRADEAMYKSKRAGKDCCHLYSSQA